MSKFKYFLGIYLSKEYFDAVVIVDGNTEKNCSQSFCLEHAGLYG